MCCVVYGEPGFTVTPLQVDKEHLAATGWKGGVVAPSMPESKCAAGQAGLMLLMYVCGLRPGGVWAGAEEGFFLR